jgi:hypothetical protein|tara:strand:- start:1918 stop:2034 length:117 start_codon:yes stop_codon:yes gene_type:complete
MLAYIPAVLYDELIAAYMLDHEENEQAADAARLKQGMR